MDELKVMLVDDEPEVSKLMELMLKRKAPEFSIVCAESGMEAIELLRKDRIDCVLSDYQMPGMTGLELLKELRGMGHDVPFIFVTGQGNEEVASEAFKEGANDYFTKEIGFAHFTRIINSVEQAVRQRDARAAEARYQAEVLDYNHRLEAAKKEWEATFDAISDPVTIHDGEFNILRANSATARVLGMDTGEIIGRKCYELFHHIGRPIADCPGHELLQGTETLVTHEVDVNGRFFEVSVYPLGRQGGQQGFVHVAKDVTERKKAEDARAASMDMLDTLLQSAHFGMIVVGRDKRIRRINRAALSMLGFGSDTELVGKVCHDNICPAEIGQCPVIDLGHTIDHSVRTMLDRQGNRIKILKSVSPITLGDEEVLLESFVDLRGGFEDIKLAA